MSSSGFDSNAPSDAEMAALRSTMASLSVSSVGDSHPRDTLERARAASEAEMAALRSTMASVSLRSVGDSNPRDTSGRARAGLLTLPPELRLRIYKMLIQPRGTVEVDTLYAVRTAGSRTNVVSYPIGARLRDLWTSSPDALSIILTNKRLYREAADFLYTDTVFKIANLSAFVIFLDMFGPTEQAVSTTLELNLCTLEEDDFDNIDNYHKLRNLSNKSSLTITIDSHILDVVAVQSAHFRTRFASQLAPPGHWWSDESIDIAEKHLGFLRQVAGAIVSQAEDAASKRERLKIMSIVRWTGPSARQRAAMMSKERAVLQSEDYDEIEASVLPRIEQELEDGGWCA